MQGVCQSHSRQGAAGGRMAEGNAECTTEKRCLSSARLGPLQELCEDYWHAGIPHPMAEGLNGMREHGFRHIEQSRRCAHLGCRGEVSPAVAAGRERPGLLPRGFG